MTPREIKSLEFEQEYGGTHTIECPRCGYPYATVYRNVLEFCAGEPFVVDGPITCAGCCYPPPRPRPRDVHRHHALRSAE